MNKEFSLHTRGDTCCEDSSGVSLSCLMLNRRSADGVFSVGVECESLDSARRLPLSALGVEGVLTDLVPLDLSLALVKVPELSRFCK